MRREKNTVILSSVLDRRENEDRTEAGPRPVQPIFWDRRSRFGPVDRQSVGLWPSLHTMMNMDSKYDIMHRNEMSCPLIYINNHVIESPKRVVV